MESKSGAFTAPLLLITMTTGVLMVFAPLRTAVLGTEVRPTETLKAVPGAGPAEALLGPVEAARIRRKPGPSAGA